MKPRFRQRGRTYFVSWSDAWVWNFHRAPECCAWRFNLGRLAVGRFHS